MTAGGTVVEMLEIAALFLGSTVIALVALLAVVRNRAEQSRQPDEPVTGDEPGDEAESGALAEDDSPAGRRARRKARLAALRQRAGDAPTEEDPPDAAAVPAGPTSDPSAAGIDGAPPTPAGAPSPVDPTAAAPEPGGTVPTAAPETPAASETSTPPPPAAPEPDPAGDLPTDDAAPSAALPPPNDDAAATPPVPAAAPPEPAAMPRPTGRPRARPAPSDPPAMPTASAGTPYGRAPGAGSPYAAAPPALPTDPDPTASPPPSPPPAAPYRPPSTGTPYGRPTAATPYGGGPPVGAQPRAPAPAPSAPTPPPPRPTGRVVLGIDPTRTDEPEGPQRHGVTPAEELTSDQLRRLNPRARRAALRKQNQKPLPDLDAIPPDLKQEVIALLGQGKKIKAFGVFRKRLDISFKDAEKGVALVAHEADLDLD